MWCWWYHDHIQSNINLSISSSVVDQTLCTRDIKLQIVIKTSSERLILHGYHSCFLLVYMDFWSCKHIQSMYDFCTVKHMQWNTIFWHKIHVHQAAILSNVKRRTDRDVAWPVYWHNVLAWAGALWSGVARVGSPAAADAGQCQCAHTLTSPSTSFVPCLDLELLGSLFLNVEDSLVETFSEVYVYSCDILLFFLSNFLWDDWIQFLNWNNT